MLTGLLWCLVWSVGLVRWCRGGGRWTEGGGRVIEQVWEGQLTCWDYKLSGMAPVPRADSFQVGPSDCPCKA